MHYIGDEPSRAALITALQAAAMSDTVPIVVVNKPASIGHSESILEGTVPTRQWTPEEWEKIKFDAWRSSAAKPKQKGTIQKKWRKFIPQKKKKRK